MEKPLIIKNTKLNGPFHLKWYTRWGSLVRFPDPATHLLLEVGRGYTALKSDDFFFAALQHGHCDRAWPMGCLLDRSQSLFDFVPQEKSSWLD